MRRRAKSDSIDIPEEKSLFSHTSNHVPIGNIVCRVGDKRLMDATETYLKGINKDARLYCDDAIIPLGKRASRK